MPVDHYKMTMEAKPLRLLYSKYAPQALLNTGSIRPLGTVRRCSNGDNDEDTISLSRLEGEVSRVERVQRYLEMSGSSPGLMDTYGSGKSLQSLPAISEGGKSQGDKRSKKQDFEQKYKLAMTRGNQDQKIQNVYSKRVIHLPLLKINLETYVGDTEDTKALESTRKSLRHILDAGRKPGGPVGTVSVSAAKQPGITQYHFQTPAEQQREGYKTSKDANQFLERVPFVQVTHKHDGETEPALRLESVNEDVPFTAESACAIVVDGVNDDDCIDEIDRVYEVNVVDGDNSSVHAQRLSSAATLGTSFKNSDLEQFSTETEGERSARANAHTHRHADSSLHPKGGAPVWPSFDDMKNLRSDYGYSSLAIQPRIKEVQFLERGSSVIIKRAPPDSFVIRNGVKPKLKYTVHRKKQTQKLEPIDSAPHTERECAMCNLFKVKEPTPCPPNTPRHPGDLLPDIVTTINQDSLGVGTIVEEGEGEAEGEDETDKSDIEFRRRHKLLNYDIHYTPPTLDAIDRRTDGREVTEYRLKNLEPKKS